MWLTDRGFVHEVHRVTVLGIDVHHWTNERGASGIDFLLDTGRGVMPLEAQAKINPQSKSLKDFACEFHPAAPVRSPMPDHRREDRLLNLPLYIIGSISFGVTVGDFPE
jgi:hypothetical protein